MCSKFRTPTTLENHESLRSPPNRRYMKFENDVGGNIPGIAEKLPSDTEIPMHGYAAFALGSIDSVCMCGWNNPTVAGMCRLPPAVCVALSRECDFAVGNAEIVRLVAEAWPSEGDKIGWACPEMDLSDAWGVATDVDADRWILTSSSSSQDNITMRATKLLASGRGGICSEFAMHLRIDQSLIDFPKNPGLMMGNAKTETLKAFSAQEMDQILKGLP